jgi:hypothetical protein
MDPDFYLMKIKSVIVAVEKGISFGQSVIECHAWLRVPETLNPISSRQSNVNTHLIIWQSLN